MGCCNVFAILSMANCLDCMQKLCREFCGVRIVGKMEGWCESVVVSFPSSWVGF